MATSNYLKFIFIILIYSYFPHFLFRLLLSHVRCVSVPVWAERLSGCLWRNVGHAEILNSEFPIILLCTHDGNYTTWKRISQQSITIEKHEKIETD